MNSSSVAVAYAELDALLDTRMGTIARMGMDLAEAVLLSGKYHTRESDQFEGVDEETYKDLYAKRDVITLKHSVATRGVSLLANAVRYLKEQATVRPYHQSTKVVINTYPYKLSVEEVAEMGKAIVAWISGLAPVEFVFMSPEELVPQYVKQESYSMMLMYEYDPWMSLHYNPSKRDAKPIEDVTIFAPAIYFLEKLDSETIQQLVDIAAHPLQAVQMIASPLVRLKLIDVEYFSIIRPLDQHKSPTPPDPKIERSGEAGLYQV